MKKLLLFIALISCRVIYSQEIQNHYIVETPTNFIIKAGSCSNPDGSSTETLIPPPNYQYLNDNGYCLYSYLTTSTFTACFTFIADSPLIEVNSGFSHNCQNVQFSNSRLFDASCTQIATGLSFSGLTPGQTYTWCLTMRAWGGGGCNGFETVCPYFLNIINLPIHLNSFSAHPNLNHNLIQWNTLTETDNDFFTLEYSPNGIKWREIAYIPGAGNTLTPQNYSYHHFDHSLQINYYRLSQTDYNGVKTTLKSISLDNRVDIYLVKTINLLGKEVDNNYKGIIIKIYSDGSTEKIWK